MNKVSLSSKLITLFSVALLSLVGVSLYVHQDEVTEMNKKMKESATLQEASVIEIEDALEKVGETTRENLDTSEETAHASVSLLTEAEEISHRASVLSSLVTAH